MAVNLLRFIYLLKINKQELIAKNIFTCFIEGKGGISMQVNTLNNQTFGARIKISKAAKNDIRDGAIVSSLGTSLSGSGALSSVPASDPIHHIHYSAKVMDGAFATAGSVLSAGGAACMKFAHSLFKSAIRNSKIPS